MDKKVLFCSVGTDSNILLRESYLKKAGIKIVDIRLIAETPLEESLGNHEIFPGISSLIEWFGFQRCCLKVRSSLQLKP